MRNAGLEEAQAGIKIAGRNINNLRYADDHPYGRKWRGTKMLLDESESGEWKSWLKAQHSEDEDHGIRSHHFREIDGEQWKQCQTLFFWAPKSLQMVIAAMKLKDAYSLDTTLMAESEEELKSLLMKVKVESEKVGLKLNIQKTKIMASGPTTSWGIDGEQWKQCQTLFFWAPKSLQMVTAAMKLKDAYSLEGKFWPP